MGSSPIVSTARVQVRGMSRRPSSESGGRIVDTIARPSRGTAAIARGPLRDELVEAARDLDVSFLGGVLVAQRGRAGSVAHAVHQLRGRGAGRRGDRVGGVSEIVEVEVRREIGDRGAGVFPVAVDGALAQYLGVFPGEEVAVPSGSGEVGEVVSSSGMRNAGSATVRTPASVLGAPTTRVPSLSSTCCCSTRTVRWRRSTWRHSRPRSSPLRRPRKPASRIRHRYRAVWRRRAPRPVRRSRRAARRRVRRRRP